MKTEYKLLIEGNKYKYMYGTKDQDGKQFAIFERRKWLTKERVKFSKEDLEIDYKTGICNLKINQNLSNRHGR